ncbi:hypothetical protein AMS68_001330 [Peltaster fructicola]|uniref:Major facilitator superfamily (MFS) profile domain-containing protein n=1 Tax=Peltaster fructicola TaxID=286661 RepID=A0A6H0XM71_9PEZI|nr:hypothetical protein AMS68_001330 [Peltaster fructicola]
MASTARDGVPERSIFHRMFWPEDQTAYSAGFSRDQDFERAITAILNRTDHKKTPFKWRVYWVAALGFLTDSYNLFASNVVLPALSSLYWNTPSRSNIIGFNVATLIGSIIGQIFFGIAVDICMRSLYGFELMIVIVSTLGLLQCSSGYYDTASDQYTWSITGWLFFWRVVMGIGIGAEYPLSACIASEWSAKHSRARMLAAVFLMQPLGQLLAYIVGLIAIGQLGGSAADIDRFWRIVIGIGAAPTILALFARRLIPESWRFTYFVVKNPGKAKLDARNVYDRASIVAEPHELQQLGDRHESPTLQHDSVVDVIVEHDPPERQVSEPAPVWRPGSQFEWAEFSKFLWEYRARLLGMSSCWFLLDIAFYGMGFNSPGTLAKLWTDRPINFDRDAPYWQKNSDVYYPLVNGTFLNGTSGLVAAPAIKEVLTSTMKHAIYTTSIAAILGSSFYIGFAHMINRRHMLIGTFFALSVLLAITAGAFKALYHDGDANGSPISGGHVVLIFLWALIQLFFSFGPNTLTFVMPAEVFPTKYRCTCYGFAAASGKLGAVLVQAVGWATTSDTSDPNDYKQLQYMLAAFSVCMALGGAIALYEPCVPNVQHGFENKSLEEASNEQAVVRETPKHDDQS